jgi:hypothetical protein
VYEGPPRPLKAPAALRILFHNADCVFIPRLPLRLKGRDIGDGPATRAVPVPTSRLSIAELVRKESDNNTQNYLYITLYGVICSNCYLKLQYFGEMHTCKEAL